MVTDSKLLLRGGRHNVLWDRELSLGQHALLTFQDYLWVENLGSLIGHFPLAYDPVGCGRRDRVYEAYWAEIGCLERAK